MEALSKTFTIEKMFIPSILPRSLIPYYKIDIYEHTQGEITKLYTQTIVKTHLPKFSLGIEIIYSLISIKLVVLNRVISIIKDQF